MMRLGLIGLSLWGLSGCGWFGDDVLVTRLETGSSAPTEMPLGLTTPGYVEMMPIPEIEDPRGLSEVDYELRRPEPLSTRYGVDQIVIKKLEDEQLRLAAEKAAAEKRRRERLAELQRLRQVQIDKLEEELRAQHQAEEDAWLEAAKARCVGNRCPRLCAGACACA